MSYQQEKIIALRKKVSQINDPIQLITTFLNNIKKDEIIMDSYPSLSVLAFDKNDTIMDEDKYKGAYVIDFRVQWLGKLDGVSTFADVVDEIHYLQIHLYLYFKSSRSHSPSKLAKFDINCNTDYDRLDKNISQFVNSLNQMWDLNDYLGHALAFTDAM